VNLVKLTAPVGLSPRTSDGPKVANKPADVTTVQEMLRASGYNVPVTGKINAGLLKAIANAQTKQAKMKNPDQVVDPDGKTFKSLIPAYKKHLAELAKQKLLKVRYKGKDIFVTEAEHKKIVNTIAAKADIYAKRYRRQHKFNESVFKEYNDTAMIKNGLGDAIMQGVIITFNRVKMIDVGILIKSSRAVTDLEMAVRKKDLAAIETTMPLAAKELNAFAREVDRFLKRFIGAGETTVAVLEVTKFACFAVVGAVAAPVVVGATGVSAATAAIASGAGVSVLESAATELGKHAIGQKLTVWQSIKNVGIDGTIGAATAGIGKKIPVKFVDDIAGKISGKVASKVGALSSEAAKNLVKTYLKEGMGGGLKEALVQSVKIVGNSAKKGKLPTEKEFKDAFSEIALSAIVAGPLKDLKKVEAKFAMKSQKLLSNQLVPDAFEKMMKRNTIGKVEKAAIIKNVTSKLNGKITKIGVNAAFEKATGTETPDKMISQAELDIRQSKAIQAMIDKAIRDELKKMKIPVN
jgi:hypothetical protein